MFYVSEVKKEFIGIMVYEKNVWVELMVLIWMNGFIGLVNYVMILNVQIESLVIVWWIYLLIK